ncbi:hypothetical protein BJ999_001478 [Actinomadura citrea]|uniref:Uncharacterized protein n=1 Tax=Actinomadura citrea TaxID=46158 RepID=A0A7Y9K9X2_9ACTN|nr:hypothetical protein [Actinomadura citrea]NYE11182.1 hypothetical protein [Actinomadura citrea]
MRPRRRDDLVDGGGLARRGLDQAEGDRVRALVDRAGQVGRRHRAHVEILHEPGEQVRRLLDVGDHDARAGRQ